METFVLRWTKDNLPFWQGVDDGEKIEINAVADVINENAVLKRELKEERYACEQYKWMNEGLAVSKDKLEKENAELTKYLWAYEHQASDERIRDEK